MNDPGATDLAAPGAATSTEPRVAAAGIVGNVLEWYDFALYGYLATVFADQFFPSTDKFASLIGAYAVFALGFLARPLGGVVFGFIGDRLGRRRQLMLSVVMMGLPTFLLGLLPTYASVGILAPILLVILRFAQGLSTGGEFTGSVIFLVEHAPPARRGFFGSLANFGSMLGGLCGAAVAWLVVSILPEAALDSWGWRLPFLSGLLIMVVGLWIRRGVAESPAFQQLSAAGTISANPVRTAIREHPREIAVTIGLNWASSAGYFIVFVWLVTDFTKIVGLSLSTGLGLSTFGMLVGVVLTPVFGALSDRIGPRKVLAGAGIMAAIVTTPLLLLLTAHATLAMAAVAQFGLAAIITLYLGTLPAVFVSLHSVGVRCTSLSIGYNLAVAVFGGTSPLIATALVSVTGWPPAPGLYFAACALIGLGFLKYVPRRFADAASLNT